MNITLKASVTDDLRKIKTNSKFENFPTNEINFVISKSMENWRKELQSAVIKSRLVENECPCRYPLHPVEYERAKSKFNAICRSGQPLSKLGCGWRNQLPIADFNREDADSEWKMVY